jgi:5-methylcytosine-specific restriction endonuclease McrA
MLCGSGHMCLASMKKRVTKRTKPARLSIELVPRTAWFSNLRSILPRRDWDSLRRPVYRIAGYRCEVCWGRGERHPVEAHEVWAYDDEVHVQRLVRLIALCPACHEVKHIGLAGVRGRQRQAAAHLKGVNGWSDRKAGAYIRRAFQKWGQRSRHKWAVEVDWDALANRYGAELTRKGQERLSAAARARGNSPI